MSLQEIALPVHLTAAVLSLLLGPVQLVRRRRDRVHRRVGTLWAAAMVITCVSSFGIIDHGLSWLHGLAAFTLVTVVLGVRNARARNIPAHVGNMVGSYLGLAVAFVFAATARGRLIPTAATTQPLLLLAGSLALMAAAGAAVAIAVRAPRRRSAAVPLGATHDAAGSAAVDGERAATRRHDGSTCGPVPTAHSPAPPR